MSLRRIRLTQFRCIGAADVALDPARNQLYGPNGAGKTSFLEAIFVLGRGRSFRTRHLARLVKHGTEGFAVYGEIEQPDRVRRAGVSFVGGRLEKKIDGANAIGNAGLIDLLPVHVIDPSSHALIEGGPSERRRLIDWGVFHVEHSYLGTWRRYRRVLGQRNAALKAAGSDVATWTDALATLGEAIDADRAGYLSLLAANFAEIGRNLLGRDVSLAYRRGWKAELSLREALAAAVERDSALGTTHVGPHRADIVILLDGKRIQDEASRGQQKLAAAALVLAQERVFSDRRTGGVLLVDDPAAELDRAALDRLVGALEAVRSQLVVTALSREQFPPLDGARVFHVEHGEVRYNFAPPARDVLDGAE